MARAHNFNAGPGALPDSVLVELQAAVLEFGKTRAGIMEISHRSKAFEAVLESAQARLRRLLGVPEGWAILFQQGGASLQFHVLSLNLALPGEAPAFVDTGTWSTKAYEEAQRLCQPRKAWSGKGNAYTFIPSDAELDASAVAAAPWVHYTTNNTIRGTQFHRVPALGKPLLADMSSDICSRPVDVGAHEAIYAGAQKNLGPSGVTVVLLSPWALARQAEVKAARGGLPPMLDYAVQVENNSLYNTPSTFGIFALERVLAWVEAGGGLGPMAEKNTRKADLLYSELDRSPFWRCPVRPDSRSQMNVVWRLPTEDLEERFLKEADAAGFLGLKGHRSVGGCRASLYNAVEPASVAALVAYMRDFEAKNG